MEPKAQVPYYTPFQLTPLREGRLAGLEPA